MLLTAIGGNDAVSMAYHPVRSDRMGYARSRSPISSTRSTMPFAFSTVFFKDSIMVERWSAFTVGDTTTARSYTRLSTAASPDVDAFFDMTFFARVFRVAMYVRFYHTTGRRCASGSTKVSPVAGPRLQAVPRSSVRHSK